VTAAEVVIRHADVEGEGAVLGQSFYHITLILGAGRMPAESLKLPARVADPADVAQRVVVDPPLALQGVIAAHK
jgi:hypothetical protein